MGSCNSGGKGGSSSVDPILGKKGRAKTPKEALANTNPNRKKGRTYEENCQRCVYALEAQLRGYDVEALPAIFPERKDPMFQYNTAWEQGFVGIKWVNNLGKRNKEVEQNIVDKMQQWGSGSRAIAYVEWKDGYAHAFNIVNKGGKISILDGQSGKQFKLKDYLKDTKPSKTEIARVDNLKFDQNTIKHAVKQRGK